METLLEILKKTEIYFREKGLETPRLDAEVVVSSSLGLKRLDLYLQYDRPLKEEELQLLREHVRRRGKREPWQYIVGETEFSGLLLRCDARALIPRPETEQLVEILKEQTPAPQTILDLGCGTGALGLSLIAHFTESRLTSVDISGEALQLAKENSEKNGLVARVSFIQSDWFGEIKGTYDWIVSNPPYLTEEEWATSEPEVQHYEPRNALIGGEQGLVPYQVILSQVRKFLNPGGLLALETGIHMHEALKQLAQEEQWGKVISLKDYQGRDRFLLLRSRL